MDLERHIRTCPTAHGLAEVRTTLNRIMGGLGIVALLGALALWALNRAATKQDEMQRAIQDMRVMLIQHQVADAAKLAREP